MEKQSIILLNVCTYLGSEETIDNSARWARRLGEAVG